MRVPFLDLRAQYTTIETEVKTALDRVLESQRFILGPEVEALEREVAQYCSAAYGIGTSSGTDALLACLMALGVGAGDEVVTTAYSFFATAGAIYRTGARPVFVDIDAATYNIDPAQIAPAVGSRTKAILPVHLYGQCAAMDDICGLAQQAGVSIIEDAAQAIGAREGDLKAGSFGLAGALSFFPSKNLGGFGDGGMIVTNDAAFADKCRAIRVHGAASKFFHTMVGGNFRIDALQAAILRVKLTHLEYWTQQRTVKADAYDELFGRSGLLDIVTLPHRAPRSTHVFHQYVIRAPNRDALREFLSSAGVGTQVYYPQPLHLQACFSDLGYRPGSLPNAEQAASETLALPIYPELSDEQQQYVVDMIVKFYGRRRPA